MFRFSITNIVSVSDHKSSVEINLLLLSQQVIQVMSSRLLDNKTGEFNQIQLHSTKLVQKQDYAIEPELGGAVNLIQILQFWLMIFFRDFPTSVHFVQYKS